MYISFTYRCVQCGHQEDRFVRKDEVDLQLCPDVEKCACTVPMKPLPAGTRTTFRFADRRLKR